MDILGMVTGGFGSAVSSLPGMIMNNFIPIAAVAGLGALLTSQGIDVIGNVAGFANNAVGSFLNMIDGIGQNQNQTQEQTISLEETHGENFKASELTKEEQTDTIRDILMKAGPGDSPDTILNQAAEKLHLTDEQKESASGIVNEVFDEMKGNLIRAALDRKGLVNDAIASAKEKGLFEIIGSSPSIGDKTVSHETAQAAAPVSDTQTQTQPKTQEKAKDVGQER